MRERRGIEGLTIGLALLLAAPGGAAAQAGGLQVERFEGVPYVTGGVSVEEREALRAMAGREGFNLKVVVATEDGTYLSNVGVRVTDGEGTVRLEATTEGPWLFARLPAGEYRIEGTRDGSTRETPVTLTGDGLREVVLRIPRDGPRAALGGEMRKAPHP